MEVFEKIWRMIFERKKAKKRFDHKTKGLENSERKEKSKKK